MNTFNNAIADITRYYNVNAAVNNDRARIQVPVQDALAIFKWVREHTTGTWWTAECDIINVYSNEYDLVISKRSGNITITDMCDVFDLEQGGLFEGTKPRSCTTSPVMAAPYGKQGKETADYIDMAAVAALSGRTRQQTPAHVMIGAYGASSASIAHALDTQRNNEMAGCVQLGFTYELYCDYMYQRIDAQYRDMLTVTAREYQLAVMQFAKEIADLDGGIA